MKFAITVLAAATMAALAGCDRPTSTSSTTVVKEPVAQNAPAVQKEKETTVIQKEPVIQKEKETVVQREPSAPSSSTNITIDAGKPETTEKSRSTTTSRVDTPLGSATRTETETSKTTR